MSFAATKLSAPIAAKTSVRFPPRMADIPDGDVAAAFDISIPRARTSVSASLSEIAPDIAAAASSPTECPDVTAKFLIPSA
ncbi:unannotated protein [freshwater metagenome]|uniref:Unannotated protein n=1 Tax=freshwater metagenome TaxID=449393 RepID=A0A6J6AYU8_9ZZZZ